MARAASLTSERYVTSASLAVAFTALALYGGIGGKHETKPMMLSTGLLKSIGFEAIEVDAPMEARFHSLHVFEVRGFSVGEGVVSTASGRVAGVPYQLAAGRSLNDCCQALCGDVYADDEESWTKERRCSSPYVLVHFGPTSMFTATTGHAKTDGQTLLTYDAFGLAKEELRRLEAMALPVIELALARVYADGPQPVRLRHVHRTAYGMTPDGKTLHDFRASGHADVYVSYPLDAENLSRSLQAAVGLAQALNPRVAEFHQLASRDADDLKRFLYFFLAIEIEVHQVFGSVSRDEHTSNAVSSDSRVAGPLRQLLENRDANWLNLADRFVWCVASVWEHLTEEDVTEFKRLKAIRDHIAHGRVASPDHADVVAAGALLKRIIVLDGTDVT